MPLTQPKALDAVSNGVSSVFIAPRSSGAPPRASGSK